MDLLQKIETLLSATTRAKLPKRGRRSILDEEEEKILAEIRQALADVEAQERVLARRIKTERQQADEAAEQGDLEQRRTHERRAFELERQLEQESTQAINIEEKLAALEEKLVLAKEAVEKESRKVAERDKAATEVLESRPPLTRRVKATPAPQEMIIEEPADDPDLAARKSRLSG